MEATFDYVVVGGGSAGCVVAGRLAEDPSLRILVLEVGDRAEEHPETLRAGDYKKAFIHEALLYDRYSTPQRHCSGKPIFVGTGRGMGGSASVNAMVYTRGAAFDFADWPEGWRWPDVVPSFREIERRLDVRQMPPGRFTEACIAGASAAGFEFKRDLNDGALSGYLGYNWMNTDGDARRSSYVAFVQPLGDRPGLRVETRATARRVLLDPDRRAVGVEWERDGAVHIARARREVVLTAGALETPKLLQLSGIGPGEELRRHGIPVVVDAPEVGRHLMDHPNVQTFFAGREPNDCGWAQLYGFHRADETSGLAAGEADTCYVFYAARTSFREGVIRLVPGMALPPSLYRVAPLRRGLRRLLAAPFAIPPVRNFVERMWGIVVILGKPRSRGSVRLSSNDPRQGALVDPNYLDDPADVRALVEGVKRARAVARTPALTAWGNRELMPGPFARSDAALERFVRKNAMTTYHFAGTCRMGDGSAPLTPRLEVKGTRGLRVADASVIPSVPVSALNAPSMLVGWRAVDLMRAGN